MGIKAKDILRGVGAGLGRFGEIEREREAQEKVDARLEKSDAFKERELTVREEESALRQQQMKLSNMTAKAKMNHGNMVKTAMASGYADVNQGYGSAPMADAMTKYLGDGRAYRHTGYDETTKLPIWEIGTFETDLETGKVVEGADGKGKWKALSDIDGNPLKKTFLNEDDWLNFVNSNMNPDYMFALQADERSYAKTERDHKDRIRRMTETAAATADTQKGAVDIRKTEQAIKTDKAREKSLLAEAGAKEAKLPSTVVGIDKKKVKLSTAQMNTLINDVKSLKERYPGVNSGETYRIGKIYEDEDLSKASSDVANSVEDGTLTEEQGVEKYMQAFGLSKAIAQALLEENRLGIVAPEEPGFFSKIFGPKAPGPGMGVGGS